MSYVGNIPAEKYSSLTQQTFSSPTGTNFVLSQSVTNSADIALFVDNVRQDPSTYTAVGTALTTSAISSPSTMYCLYNGRTTETVSPPAGSVDSSHLVAGSVDDSHISGLAASKLTGTVSTSQIADDAVSLAKLAPGTDGNIISYDASGNPVAIATGSDGQVLTSAGAGAPPVFEAIPAGGFPVGARAFRGSAQTITINTWTKVQLSSETYDPNGDFDSSSDYDYTVPTGQDGVYVISGGIALDTPADAAVCFIAIFVNGSSVTKAYENTGGPNGYGTIISDIFDLDAGDLVTLYVRHASSGTISTTGTTDMTHLAIQRIA